MLAALAAVTDRLGLAGTINSTFNEPYEVARQFATLDHLSGGRAAWNVVTSWDAFTGENFRRGGFLAAGAALRAGRGRFLQTALELFDSWRGDEIVADKDGGTFLRDADAGRFAHPDAHFDISGRFSVPRSPQGRPVIFQAGDSDEGREFAASSADAIFSRHGTLEAGQAFYADVKGRLARYGRTHDELLIMPAATFVLGDTDAEAAELAHEVRLPAGSRADRDPVPRAALEPRPVRPTTPTARCPTVDPVVGENTVAKGRASVRMHRDPLATAAEWRELAEAKQLSIRELIIEVTGRQSFIGSPATVADTIDDFVQSDAADGFILVPHITPGGLDPFVDRVVPAAPGARGRSAPSTRGRRCATTSAWQDPPVPDRCREPAPTSSSARPAPPEEPRLTVTDDLLANNARYAALSRSAAAAAVQARRRPRLHGRPARRLPRPRARRG